MVGLCIVNFIILQYSRAGAIDGNFSSFNDYGKWTLLDGYDGEHQYICKGPASKKNKKPPAPPKCDQDGFESFFSYNDSCYWESDEKMTWQDAEKTCTDKGAHLVSIMDSREQYYIFSSMSQSDIWIGLHELEVYYEF